MQKQLELLSELCDMYEGKEKCTHCKEQKQIVKVLHEVNPRYVFCNDCWKNMVIEHIQMVHGK